MSRLTHHTPFNDPVFAKGEWGPIGFLSALPFPCKKEKRKKRSIAFYHPASVYIATFSFFPFISSLMVVIK